MAILLKAADGWNPSNPPLEEYIPENWCGPHVSIRLVEAFKTLAQMPADIMRRRRLTFWPECEIEYEDHVAQQEKTDEEKTEEARQTNRSRIKPTAQQISRCDQALWWGVYLMHQPQQARVVQRVAQYRARELDIETISRRMRMNLYIMRNMNRVGLDVIAVGLRRDRIRVF